MHEQIVPTVIGLPPAAAPPDDDAVLLDDWVWAGLLGAAAAPELSLLPHAAIADTQSSRAEIVATRTREER